MFSAAAMKKIVRAGLVTCGAAALSAGTAMASPINFTITTHDGDGADTHIRANASSMNFGDDVAARARHGDSHHQSYVRFDLASLEGLSITSVTLEIFTHIATAAENHGSNILVHGLNLSHEEAKRPANGGWKEVHDKDEAGEDIPNTGLTRNNAPVQADEVYDPTLATHVGTFQADRGEWVGISGNEGSALVAFLNEALAGPGVATFIFTLDGPTGTDDIPPDTRAIDADQFRTKEFSDGTFAPKLEISAIPEPASLALLGVGSLLVLARRKRVTA